MKVENVNLTVNEIVRLTVEANSITAKAEISKQDEMRHATILSKISMLRGGVSAQELAAAQTQALCSSLGIKEAPVVRRSRAEVEQWRAFLSGKDVEMRTDLQSTSQWGRPTAESYDGNSGAFTPADYDARLMLALGQYDEVVLPQYSNLWNSTRGTAATTPCIDDCSGSPVAFNSSSIIDEAYASNVTPVTAKSVAWPKAKTFRSGRIQMALELESDAFESAISLIELTFAQRHSLAFGAYAVGNIVAALPATIQNVTTASNSAVDHFDFGKLYKALPQIYRRDAIFLLSDDTHADLTVSLESNARSLIGNVDYFLQKPLVTCNSLPNFSAGQAHLAVFVNRNYLLNRRVSGGTYVKRYRENSSSVEYGLVQYESFTRLDFKPALFDSAFPPVAVLNVKS